MKSKLVSITKHRFLIILLAIFLFLILLQWLSFIELSANFSNKFFNDENESYDVSYSQESINYFADILEAKWQPTPGKSIFFHITTDFVRNIVSLSPR